MAFNGDATMLTGARSHVREQFLAGSPDRLQDAHDARTFLIENIIQVSVRSMILNDYLMHHIYFRVKPKVMVASVRLLECFDGLFDQTLFVNSYRAAIETGALQTF